MRLLFTLALIVLALAAAAPASLAKPVSSERFRNETVTLTTTDPCLGEVTETITSSGFYKVYEVGTGIHLIIVVTGTVTAVPTDSSGVTYTGHFTTTFTKTESTETRPVEELTNTAHTTLVGSDSSHVAMQSVGHVTFEYDTGEVKAQISQFTCS
jgi:hypothetical protein